MTTTPDAISATSRVDALVAEMTLDEKLAQLGSAFAFDLIDENGVDPKRFEERCRHGIGQVTRMAGATALARTEVAETINAIQHQLRTETRLGIPAIVHEECLAGFMARDATVFPQPLALGASWDPELSARMGWTIATQMRLTGATIGLAPVLDIARDPRWGRTEETLGEDPHLVSVLGLAMVLGLQHDNDGTGVIATAKHFVGHGAPEGGRNAASPHIGARELRDVYLPSFEQAVRHGRIGAVMHAYHDIDGVPCIANDELLIDVLRGQWGFEGTVISDYNGVEELHHAHQIASDLEDAAAQSLMAGLDVELPETSGFGEPLARAVTSGRVPIERVDEAVRRVLLQKVELGLFDAPPIDIDAVRSADAEAEAAALDAARATFVMLQNRNDRLPLRGDESVAVVGPHADRPRALVGDYAHVIHQLLLEELTTRSLAGSPPIPDFLKMHTVLDTVPSVGQALTEAWAGPVSVVPGCDVDSDDRSGIESAVEAARSSDVAVIVAGDLSGMTPESTCGESRDRVSLDLPGVQPELIRAVAATGTPTVLVLLSGRPNTVTDLADLVDVVFWSALPGRYGGQALAEILSGAIEPTARLPITMPRHVGQVPLHYMHNPSSATSRWRDDYADESHLPMWAFGHGLGYTTFELNGAVAPAEIASTDEAIEFTTTITNTGERPGRTVVQVYLEQPSASVVRPARRLIAFEAVELDPGQSTDVRLDVPTCRLAFVGRDHQRAVEPGHVELAVGLASDDIQHRCPITITGQTRPVDAPAPVWQPRNHNKS